MARLIGLALLVRIFEDLTNRQLEMFNGTIFPLRHYDIFPLAPPWVAVLIWILQAVAGLGLLLWPQRRVWFARLAAVVMFASLTQTFMNQKTLVFLICLYLSFEDEKKVAWALRWQLMLIYLFSFVHKIMFTFWDGAALRTLCAFLLPTTEGLRHFTLSIIEPYAVAFSIFVLATEGLAPVVLLLRPRWGVGLVVILHLGLALAMPQVITFALAMIALSLTFLKAETYD